MSAPVDVWVGSPRSYTKGRARAPQYVTLHYTAGSEGPQSAENGAAYDKTRTDGTSCHVFVDSEGLPCREVADGDRSHSALWHGNEIGIHIELCATTQTRAQWLDAKSYAMLEYAAALVADICRRHGFPIKRLSVSETRAAYYNGSANRPKGINDHYTITQAYPEDGGDHTDVGKDFPWDVFLDLVAKGGDMYEQKDRDWLYMVREYMEALYQGREFAEFTLSGVEHRDPNWVREQLLAITAAVTTPQPVTLPEEQLDALADKVAERLGELRFVAAPVAESS